MTEHRREIRICVDVVYEAEGSVEDRDLSFIVHDCEFGFTPWTKHRLDITAFPPKFRAHIEAEVECEHLADMIRERNER